MAAMTNERRVRCRRQAGTTRLVALAGLVRAVSLVLAITLVPAGAAVAQSAGGEPHDVVFKVVDATTGQPGQVERLTVDYMVTRANRILDITPEGSEFTVPGLPLRDTAEYVITAWSRGVPYWWQKRGRDLITGPVTLHVFEVTDSRAGLAVTGLNVVARRQDTILALEYMVRIENAASPQTTALGRPATFEMSLPADAADVTAEYQRGPEPTPVPFNLAGAGRLGLEAPLTPGGNTVRVTARVPWRDGLELPVAFDIPVQAWSLLLAPEGTTAEAFELEAAAQSDLPGYTRYVGPALEAGRAFAVTLKGGGAAAAGEQPEVAFTENPAAAAADTAAGESGGRSTLPFVIGGGVIIILLLTAARRRAR